MESYDTDDEDNDVDDKMNRLLEMFPQLTRVELMDVSVEQRLGSFSALDVLSDYDFVHCIEKQSFANSRPLLVLLCSQVVGSTTTLEGAVAACLLKYGDKEGKYLFFHQSMRHRNQYLIPYLYRKTVIPVN